MEKNFYQDNFEQLLKESTDNFRMYPSKRVWHSIYNDLHPSRKWPSLAIWLLLISSVVFVGLSNRNQARFNKPSGSLLASSSKPELNADAVIVPGNSATAKAAVKPILAGRPEILHNFGNENTTIDTRLNPLNNTVTDENLQSANIIAFYKTTLEDDKRSSLLNDNGNSKAETLTKTTTGNDAGGLDDPGNLTDAIKNRLGKSNTDKNADDEKTAKSKAKKDAVKTGLVVNSPDKEWIEDYAFHNKPAASKWRSRVTYELYTTPSVGYRTMKKNTPFNPSTSSSLVVNSTNNPGYEDAVSQAPAINMELGGNILYSITKKLNLKIGLQLNYTNYNINAYELKHPTMTTLMLNDLNSGFTTLSPRSTTLANSEGVYSKKLNNNTYQISLPMGADIKILGNDNFKWFAGATIQPTYIVDGNAYFISSDLKNYVTDNSLMRRWNLNAGIETFISYKTKSGIILNAGPQFRYQVLSTYSKQFTYDEKLYNLGLKIGIITRF